MFVILPDWDGFETLIRKQSCTQSACIVETTHSMGSCDHLLHDLPASRLQWPHAAPGQEPHSLVLIAAVKNIHAIAGDRVMKCGAGVFRNESEESFARQAIRKVGSILLRGISRCEPLAVAEVSPSLHRQLVRSAGA
jgi:hypothetical protein